MSTTNRITTSRHGHRSGRTGHAPRDHYQEVTDRIIAELEAGTPPWRKPWDPDKAGGPAMPRNAATGQRYRGINVLTLGMSVLAFSSGDPRWATYKQAEDRGWQVRKGERGTTGYFFKRLELRDDTKPVDDEDAVKRIPLLRAFTLFHASQIDGISAYVPPTVAEAPWRAPEAAEIILANSGAVVRIGGERAFYSPTTDHIQLPPQSAFATAEGFCGTLIHELGHWTGAPSRLNRDLRNVFGSYDYAREELRAEIGQMMVCAELGISDCDFSNNAAYVAGWLEKLRSDRKEIFRTAADAQRIADYLLAFHPDYATSQAGPPENTPTADEGDAADTPEPMPAAA
ncbi:MAG TPA: zincin-like metallopeptidase domain-containing protein [Acetobacteraceae bacterium]|nr:zincin-like metallopeptidase domain-containing protein [Acetobacteraceae bacterium]